MTPLQIILIVTAGPYGLIQLMHAIRAAFYNQEFNIGQGFLLALCIVAIVLSFTGVS